MTPRPPRAVVVIDGGEWWTYLARRVLYLAGKIWGGAGFAVVPHRAGKVHPALLRACQIYDPDYVLTYRLTVADVEHFTPEWFQIRDQDGNLLQGEERQRMLDQALEQQVAMSEDLTARDEVAAVCSQYQSGEPTEWHDFLEFLEEGDAGNFTSITDVADVWTGSVLGCPAEWGGLMGAALASHAGVSGPPTRDRDEPDVSDDDRAALTAWLLGADWATPPNSVVSHPAAATSVNTRETPSMNDRSLAHLAQLASGFRHKPTGLLVLGDSADDFALARLWRLNFGDGYWLPAALGIYRSSMLSTVGGAIGRLQFLLARRDGHLTFTSASLSTDELTVMSDRLLSASGTFVVPPSSGSVVTPIEDLPWDQHAVLGLAVQDQWNSVTTVPVNIDLTSTVYMAAPLPPPILTSPSMASLPNVTWHVDVDWGPSKAVRRRGIDALELFADRPSMMPTWTRSSRDGITYRAQRFDFINAGTRLENTLARIALRDLSLEAWAQAKGRQHGHDVRPSDAGRNLSR